jgi:ornithine cyclodeaminase/alanine dehydrogenase-like protein (mu-crystallin family)
VLTRQDVAQLLSLDDCIAAVEAAFRLVGPGRTSQPGVLSMPRDGGGFHIKAASLSGERPYFAAKVNGNFPANPERSGLPTIQGVIVLCDADDGSPLALLDSIEITTLRTAAATAVAAKHLANPGAAVAAICGCGNQGRVQLRALARVRKVLRAFAYDVVPEAARRFALEMSGELGFPVVPITRLDKAATYVDVWITCTPAHRFFLTVEHVRPGAFVAGVGADSEDKQELDPDLLARSAVVVDVLEQCAVIGELHHALSAGRMRREDVRAELVDVVACTKPGRVADDEIVVFDSTGTALEDVAAAAVVYQRALAAGRGLRVALGE